MSTLTVTTAADSGANSLRQAILDAKAGDTIAFDIPGSGVQTIAVTGPMPTIDVPLTIDGYSQHGSHANTLTDGDNVLPQIELFTHGTYVGYSPLFTLAASGVTIRGLVMDGFSGIGVKIDAPGGDKIEGNFIGTTPSGDAIPDGAASATDLIVIDGSPGNTVGGLSPASRNLISGSNGAGIHIIGSTATANVIAGNFIGTDVTGTKALGDGLADGYQYPGGVVIDGAPGNTVGGTAAGARNVISGNGTVTVNGHANSGEDLTPGVYIAGDGATGNHVLGNYIGVDVTGTTALPNAGGGIHIESADNTVGGLDDVDRNVVLGIWIQGPSATGNQVEGNYLGTDKTGDHRLGVPAFGVVIRAASGNTIGGTQSGSRNVISTTTSDLTYFSAAVEIDDGLTNSRDASHNLVAGNFIGVDASGTKALAPDDIAGGDGVMLTGAGVHDNTIGGTIAAARNVISGNPGRGVNFAQAGPGNSVLGNFIGTDVSGSNPLGNGDNGVFLSTGNTVGGTAAGASNVIAFNRSTSLFSPGGVYIIAKTDAAVLTNAIFSNSGSGIQVSGGTLRVSAPNLTSATTTNGSTEFLGTLKGAPDTEIRVEFFANPTPGPNETVQGEFYLGFANVPTDPNGKASFDVTISNPHGQGPLFTATATAPGGVTSAFSSGIIGITSTAPAADLSVSGVGPTDQVLLGNQVIYTLTVRNNGPDSADGVSLTDTLPDGEAFVSAQPTPAALAGNALTFSLGDLENGALSTITLVVNPGATGSFTNKSTVAAGQGGALDPVSGNNSSLQTAIVITADKPPSEPGNDQPAPQQPESTDLSVAVSRGAPTVSAGQDIVYYVTVTNASDAPADHVNALDMLPVGVSVVSAMSSQGQVTPEEDGLATALGTIAPGAQATLTIEVAVGATTGTLVNSVRVSADEVDADPGNNTASVITTIVAAPTVVSGRRLGYHRLPTTLVLNFSAGLDAKTARNVDNYVIVGPNGHTVAIKSAVYDANKLQVRLRPAVRLKIRDTYTLTVKGEGHSTVNGADGAPLVGTGSGLAGSDYVAKVLWWKLKPIGSQISVAAHPHGPRAIHRAATGVSLLHA